MQNTLPKQTICIQLVRSVLNLRDRHVAIPNVLTLLSCVVHGVGNYFVSNIFLRIFMFMTFKIKIMGVGSVLGKSPSEVIGAGTFL